LVGLIRSNGSRGDIPRRANAYQILAAGVDSETVALFWTLIVVAVRGPANSRLWAEMGGSSARLSGSIVIGLARAFAWPDF
jgi:hypothetical protein